VNFTTHETRNAISKCEQVLAARARALYGSLNYIFARHTAHHRYLVSFENAEMSFTHHFRRHPASLIFIRKFMDLIPRSLLTAKLCLASRKFTRALRYFSFTISRYHVYRSTSISSHFRKLPETLSD